MPAALGGATTGLPQADDVIQGLGIRSHRQQFRLSGRAAACPNDGD